MRRLRGDEINMKNQLRFPKRAISKAKVAFNRKDH
jgi:hypothetical protein